MSPQAPNLAPAPLIPGFTVRPVCMEDAEAWAAYAVLPEVKAFTRSTVTTVDDVRQIIQRVLERCGFQREGKVRNYRVMRGEPADYWLYAAVPGDVTALA